MKKNYVFATIGLALIAMSCKKDYTCDCTIVSKIMYNEEWSELAEDQESTTNFSETLKLKKKDAEEWCDEYNSTSNSTDFAATTIITSTCELK